MMFQDRGILLAPPPHPGRVLLYPGIRQSIGMVAMEMLLVAVGIVGGAGLLSLLQSKSPLPSEADFNKANEKLKLMPEDPDANTVAGKYIAFVLGDYDAGMVFLSKSSDTALRTLAEHERAPLYTDTAPKKIAMGDEWVAAAKGFPALFRIFYDRASHWYALAWPDVDGIWKDKLRERAHKLAAARPPGAVRSGLPTGWQAYNGAGGRSPVLDGTIAHAGSYSVKLPPADEKVKESMSVLQSDLVPVSGKSVEMGAYVLTDGSENSTDALHVDFYDQTGRYVSTAGPYVSPDVPFWTWVNAKIAVPENVARCRFSAVFYSKKGNMWVDGASIKLNGKEILKNGSFEEK